MKILKLILFCVALALLSSIGYGQSVINQGNTNTITRQLGGLAADKWFILPSDTLPELTTSLIRHGGLIAYKYPNLYLYDTVNGWVPVGTPSDYVRRYSNVDVDTFPQSGFIYMADRIYSNTGVGTAIEDGSGNFVNQGSKIEPTQVTVTDNNGADRIILSGMPSEIIGTKSGDLYSGTIQWSAITDDRIYLTPDRGGTLVTDSMLIDSVNALTLQKILNNGEYATGKNAILTNGIYRSYKMKSGDSVANAAFGAVYNRSVNFTNLDSNDFLSALRGNAALATVALTATNSPSQVATYDATVNIKSNNNKNWTFATHPNINCYRANIGSVSGATGIVDESAGYFFTATNAAPGLTLDKIEGYLCDYGGMTGAVTYTRGFVAVDMNRGTNNTAFYSTIAGANGVAGNWDLYASTGYSSYHAGEFRIGATTDYGDYKLHVTGKTIGSDTIRTSSVFREDGITSSLLKTNSDGTHAPAISGTDYQTPLIISTGLANTAGTITNNLSTGISGGQTINGGTAANDDLTIEGTTHATKTTSYVNLQPNGGYVGIGTTTPNQSLEIFGTNAGSAAANIRLHNNGNTNSTGSAIEFYSAGGLYGDLRGERSTNDYGIWRLRAYDNDNTTPAMGINLFASVDGVTDNPMMVWLLGNVSNSNFTASGLGIGLGITAASAKIHAVSTTKQMRLGYDVSNYVDIDVSNTGVVTIDAVGSGASHVFSDPVSSTGTITATMMRIAYTQTNAGTLSPAVNTNYYFNGTTSTWTLPAVAANANNVIMVRNAGTGTITVNSSAGGNDIVITTEAAAANTVPILSGEQKLFRNYNNSLWIIE